MKNKIFVLVISLFLLLNGMLIAVGNDATIEEEINESVETVEIEPVENQKVEVGEELLFDASAYDSEGNLIEDDVAAFEWENASSNGVFYKEETGKFNVTATYENVTSEPTLVRVYEELYTLDVTVEGNGTVDRDPEEDSFLPGTEVNLTAKEDEHWYFVNWTGDATGTNTTLNITMDSDKSITAVFEANEYNLTVNIEGNGTVEDHEEFEFTDGETKNYTQMTGKCNIRTEHIHSKRHYRRQWYSRRSRGV